MGLTFSHSQDPKRKLDRRHVALEACLDSTILEAKVERIVRLNEKIDQVGGRPHRPELERPLTNS